MIYLDDLRLASGGQLFGEVAADGFNDFCYDWRLVQPGQLYIALHDAGGYDGHSYIADAIAGGAAGVLCTQPPTDIDITGTTVVVVPDTAAALSAWAKHVLAKYDTVVVGVAGSTGKSSTKEAVAAVLGTRYAVFKSPHTFNGELGLALGLGGLSAEHRVAILELASDRFGEMADVLAVASPRLVVLTNAIPTRAEQLSSQSHILPELQQVVASLPRNGGLVYNYDDDGVRQLSFDATVYTTSYGLDIAGRGFGADLLAYNIQVFPDRVGFDLRHQDERLAGLWIPTLGTAHLYTALAALGVGLLFEVPLRDGAEALTALRPLPGRMALMEGVNGSYLIDDSFDANAVSTAAALDLLESLYDGQRRRILILGDVEDGSEGTDAAATHYDIGRRVSEACDLLVTRGRMASLVGRAAIQGGMSDQQVRVVYNHGDATRFARNVIAPGDVVLVKGSRSAQMERVVEGLLADPERDGPYLPRRAPTWIDTPGVREGVNSWIDLDLEALAHNTRQLKAGIGPDVALMAVVKANAYGHGMVEVASTAINNGAEVLGVDNLDEAIALREAGLGAPIQIIAFTPAWAAREALANDLSVTLYDVGVAREFNRVAAEMGRTAKVHIKVDSGFGRLGVLPEEIPAFFRELTKLDNLELEGIFTHCSVADRTSEVAYTQEQIARFRSVLDTLRATGITFRRVHAANSAATLSLPESHFDMVRVGLAMYGLAPSDEVPLPPAFRRVLTWKTTVAQVKTLPPGSYVGYGNTYQTSGSETLAIIPVGYADGFRRAPRNWYEVLVRGQRARLVGRVSMGMSAANVTHIPGVRIGDEVVLIGQQGDDVITAEDVARRLDTINYEVVTALPPHIPRII